VSFPVGGAAAVADQPTVVVDGHRIPLTNLDKVMYPATGASKADVIGYYAAVAGVMVPHVTGRPVTRKRWPDGVDATPFFEKNLGNGVPAWVPRREIQHSDRMVSYPLVGSAAALVWLGQSAALELHVPQWFFGPRGARHHPDRLVFDLDPGPGVGLAECAEVARSVREVLGRHGSELYPVTSGSKGLHLYLGLNGTMTSDEASDFAHRLAETVEKRLPDLVVSRMARSLRPGKVFIDWSQNSASKTTIAPYSLRGRDRPMVAAPRTWEELEDPALVHLDFQQVLDRIATVGDPMAALGRGESPDGAAALAAMRATVERAGEQLRVSLPGPGAGGSDRLKAYRAKRRADRTPEPVPAPGIHLLPAGPANRTRGNDDTFVIQEHHARRLHWDLRLERGGVLVSWAVPKGIPREPRVNHLAVHTEDHPLEYATFSGTIPRGEYGGGEMTIWDSGTYATEKWRDDEVIVVLHGSRAAGRYALIRTDGKNWLMHRMKDQTPESWDPGPRGSARRPLPPPPELAPMLATPGSLEDVEGGWANPAGSREGPNWRFEAKWDGIRAIATVVGGSVSLRSRVGNDLTPGYPELTELGGLLTEHSVVLDGEIVALGPNGAPHFGTLQHRMGLSKPADVAVARRAVGVLYYVFDVLFLDGVSLLRKSYDDRRRVLEAMRLHGKRVSVPAQLAGPASHALAESDRRHLEGIVAKRADSVYEAGRRSSAWLKIKLWRTQDVVVVGWRPGAGRRAGGIGSLLLAVNGADGLEYAGRVGTGFTDAALAVLLRRLEPLRRKTSPVATTVPPEDAGDAVWVRPALVGEVEYSEVTHDHRLRQASWRGLREDVPVGDVRWDTTVVGRGDDEGSGG
jgi:bifunctional non-homologous end joining protein LigD